MAAAAAGVLFFASDARAATMRASAGPRSTGVPIKETEVVGGQDVSLYAYLSEPAPEDMVVTLEAASPNIQVPPSIMFPEGESRVDFLVKTKPVEKSETVTIWFDFKGQFVPAP
jgi:hypothetical protein